MLFCLFSRGKWKWSTGVKPKLSSGFAKIVSYSAQEISPNLDGVYCFLVTNDDQLQMENCTLKHPYICGLYTGNSYFFGLKLPKKVLSLLIRESTSPRGQ